MATTTTERPATPPQRPDPPALSPLELARWGWRQLTSMRTALILLFLLALGAVPGSVIPQTDVDSVRASRWQEEHTTLAPIYDKLGLFSVYDSVWFSAIYLLLMVSLVGCIVPRLRVYWRGVRADVPRAPRRLDRLPEHRSWETDEAPEVVLERAHAALRSGRYRARLDAAEDATPGSVRAERGRLREAGNLLFHLSILVVLVGFATGSLLGFKGGAIVVTKDGFANTLTQYDDFKAGSFFDTDSLAPFDFTVDSFDVTFLQEGRQAGMAQKFRADLTYRTAPGAPDQEREISVNHPLSIDDTDVFLIGHGYAPNITVRDADGEVAYSGPTVFLPEDATFRSFGVVKVNDAKLADGRDTQIGLEGEFYPTYGFTDATGPFAAFPDSKNPAISMLAYSGDLGTDDGDPQSVYALDKSGLKPILKADGKPLRIDLALGSTAKLPDGMGTVTFDGLSRFVKLQVSHTPGQGVALAGVVLALVGLLGSLFIRPRRVWVRARREGRRTLVEVAGLDRSAGGDLSGELDELVERLRPKPPTTTASPEETT
ncbi:cytochrome c biogenesis protein [Nocardioides scoriae]|uniref:Cytochrome c biogenesis protein n=1 Tax=Nocardioides scoriae TaxID=642780 RepID=A0A1H1TSB2_9ACTN|nr:cytochrome c biogenesis protein ResB [Nocardioides scoriae]SDS63110.1 cytochrome c biogenesis protein [Nocardioides scoriae]